MESMASRIVTAVEDKLKDHDAPKQNSAGDGLVGAMEGVQLDDTAGTPTSNREPKPDNDKRSAQSSFAGQIAERAQLVKQYTDKAVKECLSDVEEGKLQVDPQVSDFGQLFSGKGDADRIENIYSCRWQRHCRYPRRDYAYARGATHRAVWDDSSRRIVP